MNFYQKEKLNDARPMKFAWLRYTYDKSEHSLVSHYSKGRHKSQPADITHPQGQLSRTKTTTMILILFNHIIIVTVSHSALENVSE